VDAGVKYQQPRMDIELVPREVYTMAKPLTERGERFYATAISPTVRAMCFAGLGGFRRAAA
jgi:hypothetical protein